MSQRVNENNEVLSGVSLVLEHRLALALIKELYQSGKITKEVYKKAADLSKKCLESNKKV